MNGRVLANAGVFALGIILILGGAWAIWRGSGYIQLEWGWASVISGSVAATGGVLAVAIGTVLQRLDAIHGALLRVGAGAMPQAVEELTDETPTAPMPLGIEPSPPAREPEPQIANYADPVVRAATAINIELLAGEHGPEATEHAEAPPPPPVEFAAVRRELPPEVAHAADQGPADDMAHAAGVGDEPELDAAIEELLAEERGRFPDPAPEGIQPAAAASVEAPAQVPEAAAVVAREEPEQSPQRAGWRGLFSRKERRQGSQPPAEQPGIEPALEAQAQQATAEPDPSAALQPAATQSPAAQAESIPRTGDDWFDRALSGLDEVYEPSGPRAGKQSSHDERREDVGQSNLEVAPPAAEEQPPSSAPAAEPAVIGRYTSGNTTYVMFADGSIEAETPTGVLHFASLADLKVYVEGGQ
jgi:hypothetical protein